MPGQQPEVPLPRLVAPKGAVAEALDDGAIGVVDPGGVVRIEPDSARHRVGHHARSLAAGPAGTRSGAAGEGTMRMPDCQPTCATGGIVELPARIVLSGVKTCDGRRYFDRGEVRRPRTRQRPAPATYLRAPC